MRLETKGHFCDARKRFFAINERAHERSLQRNDAEGYGPVISAFASQVAVTGKVIPIAAMSGWRSQQLGDHQDRALVSPLGDALRRYFDDDRAQISDDTQRSRSEALARSARMAGLVGRLSNPSDVLREALGSSMGAKAPRR